MILSLEQIVSYLNYFGIYLNKDYISFYEQAIIFGLGNIFWLILLFFLFYVLYKLFSRLVNSLF